MHKKQPGKPVKTKRTKEITYFANLFCLVTQKSERLADGASNELSFPPVQQCTYRVLGKSIPTSERKADRYMGDLKVSPCAPGPKVPVKKKKIIFRI